MNESRILLVDDQTINLKLLNEMLANQGYAFSFAKNGKKALELLTNAVEHGMAKIDYEARQLKLSFSPFRLTGQQLGKTY